jgi:hypothetical protein
VLQALERGEKKVTTIGTIRSPGRPGVKGGSGSSIGPVGDGSRPVGTVDGKGPVAHDPPGCGREEAASVEAEAIRQSGRMLLAMTGVQDQQN